MKDQVSFKRSHLRAAFLLSFLTLVSWLQYILAGTCSGFIDSCGSVFRARGCVNSASAPSTCPSTLKVCRDSNCGTYRNGCTCSFVPGSCYGYTCSNTVECEISDSSTTSCSDLDDREPCLSRGCRWREPTPYPTPRPTPRSTSRPTPRSTPRPTTVNPPPPTSTTAPMTPRPSSESEPPLTVPSAENDVCQNALPLLVDGSSVEGSTIDATAEKGNDSQCRSPVESPGVWFKVMGTGTRMTASTCGSSFATKLHLLSGDSCEEAVCLESHQDENMFACKLGSLISWSAKMNRTYYLLLEGDDGASGDYVLTLDSDPPVSPFSHVFPSSDNPSNSTAIVIGVVGGIIAVTSLCVFIICKRRGSNFREWKEMNLEDSSAPTHVSSTQDRCPSDYDTQNPMKDSTTSNQGKGDYSRYDGLMIETSSVIYPNGSKTMTETVTYSDGSKVIKTTCFEYT